MILALAVCAVLAGARSVTAIADWATYSEGTTRAGLGIIGVAVLALLMRGHHPAEGGLGSPHGSGPC